MNGVQVREGDRLLSSYAEGPGLEAHRAACGELPHLDRDQLLALAHEAGLRGRGGAGFPFATKLEAVLARSGRLRRPVVVVNLSEGEPASHKDAALAWGRPHLVLDGAVLVARALAVRQVHVVVAADHEAVRSTVRSAVGERTERVEFVLHEADPRFVAGQARAVLELMDGRPNLPVTAWVPEAFEGHRGRPTLLSNAETWAQLAARALPGLRDRPPTTLLTLDGERAPLVVEAVEGQPWSELVPAHAGPVLVGGYHGCWVTSERLAGLPVLREEMAAAGVPLGAGAVVPLAAGECPVTMTARVAAYLAGESAGRCGPCVNGLPALAAALTTVAHGPGDRSAALDRVRQVAGVVVGRGACAHPDGTVRLVRSLLEVFADDVAAHVAGGCRHPARTLAASR